MINQGSPEWHRQRIGLFTSSKIADLMVKGKSSEFGDTAMSYIYRVAAERTLSDEFLSGAGFEMYIDRMDMTSKSIRWGQDFENMAREKLSEVLERTVYEAEFIKVSDYFGGSSDGKVDSEGMIIPIEIKCPTPGVFKQYQQIRTPEQLYKASKDYYYQCFGHMIEYNSPYCLFAPFDPMQKKSLHIVEIERDNSVIDSINERLFKANILVNEINNSYEKSNYSLRTGYNSRIIER